MIKNIFLFGFSGHALVVADCLDSKIMELKGYFDREEKLAPYPLKYFGNERNININEIINDEFAFPSVGNNEIRKRLVELFDAKNINQIVISNPKAIISNYSEIGLSTLIGPGAIVNSGATIGIGVIINSGAIIEHECQIGNFAHIAPGATLAGNVQIGESSFIGANSVVKEGVKIGSNVIIGAGSVVLHNVSDNEVWVGNPAKKLR